MGQECDTPACKRNEERVQYLLDTSVDPCEDFFQFACNSKKRGKKYPYAREDVTLNLTELVVEASGEFSFLKDFYQSCVSISTQFSTEDVAQYCLQDKKCPKEELEKFGSIYVEFQQHVKDYANETSWPVLTNNWENKSKNFFNGEGFSWHKLSEDILKQEYYLGAFQYVRKSGDSIKENFFSNVFFAPMIDYSVNKESLSNYYNSQYNTNSEINQIIQEWKKKKYTSKIHIIPMTFPNFLISDMPKHVEKYKKIMMSVMKLLDAEDEITEKDMSKVLENERKLAKFSKFEFVFDFYDIEKGDFEELTLSEMNELLPKVNWIDFVNTVLQNPNVTVNGSEKVLIPGKERMKNIYDEINKLSDREQANLLLWRTFAKFATNFLKTGTQQETMYENIFDSEGASSSRSENCVNQIKTFFPNILDDLIINHYLLPEEKNNIIKMFEDIKNEFANIIDQSEWLQRETKIEAHKKLDNMKINVGSIRSDNLPETLNQIKVDDYLGNIRKIGNTFWSKMVQSLRIPKDYFSGETVENAFYSYIFNQVQINVGLIKGKGIGYSRDLPRALMYGGFTASTLGHELTHGFDATGIKYDEKGEQRNWWDSDSKEAYEKKTECMVDQYNNFTIYINGTKKNTDGKKPLRENISDNGGVKIGYR